MIEDPNGSPDVDSVSEDFIIEMIEAMDDKDYASIMRLLDVTPVPHNDTVRHNRAVALAAERLMKSTLYDEVLEVVSKTAKFSETAIATLRARVLEYLEVGYNFYGSYQQLRIDMDDFDADVTLTILVDAMVGMISAASKGDDECGDYSDYYYEFSEVREQRDWNTVNWESVNEMRKENGLVAKHYSRDRQETDPVLERVKKMVTHGDPHAVGYELMRSLNL